MIEQFNTLNSNNLNRINLANRINQLGQTPIITNYQNNSHTNNSHLDIAPSNYLQPMDNGNDSESEEETPKMEINFNSNNKEFISGISHEDTQKEKNTNIETKATTNKVNSNIKIEAIPIPIIQNIVATANLNCELKLKEIALQLINAEYNAKRFSGIIMSIKEPKTTSLIFYNGKIIVLGAKTEEDSLKACRKVTKIIRSLNYPVKFSNFKIQNIVSSCDTKFQIDLMQLNNIIAKHKGKSRAHFEPELFPGLIYKFIPYLLQNIEDNESLPNITLIIFNSGKIIICGAKNRNQIYEVYKKVYPILYQAKVKVGNKPKRKK